LHPEESKNCPILCSSYASCKNTCCNYAHWGCNGGAKCDSPGCKFLHPGGKQQKCYYEENPSGCTKPDCNYFHSKPRAAKADQCTLLSEEIINLQKQLKEAKELAAAANARADAAKADIIAANARAEAAEANARSEAAQLIASANLAAANARTDTADANARASAADARADAANVRADTANARADAAIERETVTATKLQEKTAECEILKEKNAELYAANESLQHELDSFHFQPTYTYPTFYQYQTVQTYPQ
jgi:hypothetical protein